MAILSVSFMRMLKSELHIPTITNLISLWDIYDIFIRIANNHGPKYIFVAISLGALRARQFVNLY